MRIIYVYKALKDQILSSKFARLHDSLLLVFWGNCWQKRPNVVEAKVNNRKVPCVPALKLPFQKRVWICAGRSMDPCSLVALNSILVVWHVFKPVLWSVEASPAAGICRVGGGEASTKSPSAPLHNTALTGGHHCCLPICAEHLGEIRHGMVLHLSSKLATCFAFCVNSQDFLFVIFAALLNGITWK